MCRSLKILLLLFAVGLGAPLLHVVAARQIPAVNFSRDIQPIFQAHCVGCHGSKKQEANLRLDEKASALRVITPGQSAQTRLLQRLLGLNGEPRMPLHHAALPLAQIELIKHWIDEGAIWSLGDSEQSAIRNPQSAIQKHWAFVAPTRPVIPAVKNKAWVKNPIDNFVLAKLEQHGLAPSPEAAKTQLIRRVSLDLTGLPPTIEEVENFVADTSPNAYEKLVDRLLSSPHYGEQWGRHWLDVARYADTNGFEKDQARTIWPYRDWVIKAFNQNMPFDQFTTEQLAGDLLPQHPDQQQALDQKIATGFLRNSMRNEEGSVYPEQFRVESLTDRVDTMGKAFLGLTINCAQCHTHKFDPIKHDEYYKFYAFFNSDEEPYLEVPSEEIRKKRAEITSKITHIEDELLARDMDLQRRLTEWEKQSLNYHDDWETLKIDEFFSSRAKVEEYCDDGSIRVESYRYTDATFFIKAKTQRKNITGFRLELLTDPALRRNGPGVSENGTLSLSEFTAEATPVGAKQPGEIIFSQAQADFERPDAPVKFAIDGDQQTGWNSDAGPGLRNQDRKIVFTTKTPIGGEGGTNLSFALFHQQGKVQITGRLRLAVTTAATPGFDPLPATVRRIISLPAQQRTEAQQREVLRYFISLDEKSVAAKKAIEEVIKEWPDSTTTLTLAARSTPRETKIFKRGDWRNKGETVTPDTPSFLNPLPKDAPRNRLGLAQWVVAKENPLTARVIVNRVWQQYFGNGFVASPEDFGTRCEAPSHPELLDWLAVAFRDGIADCGMGIADCGTQAKNPSSKWGMKAIHRLIVTSATYRQSSQINPQSQIRNPQSEDPYNKWLARAPRLRVEAETIRDLSFAAAGLLSHKIGGAPVFPPIPDGVLDLAFGGAMKWETSQGEDRYRRAMYTFWKRSVPYPSLSTFDAPNADVSCPRRIRSNTPLQALTTLNDKLFMEAAQGLALRVWKEGGNNDRSKLHYAFQLCTARKPDQLEEQELLTLLQTEYENFQGKTAMAVYVSAADLANLPPDVDLHKVAAWTMVARVLLNLDETITRK